MLMHRAFLGAMAAVGLSLAGGSALAGSQTWTFDTQPTDLEVFSNNPEWYKAAGGNPGGYLSITDAANSQYSALVFPDIDAGQRISAFTFECDVRLGSGTSDRPADGFSLNFAREGDPVLVAAEANKGNPDYDLRNDFVVPGGPEIGTKTGLTISFDTWSGNALPDGADVEGIIVRVDNKTIKRQSMAMRHGACDDVTSLETGPRDATGAGSPDGLCWQKAKVMLDADGKLTVTYKGVNLLDAFQTTFFPSAGRLVFAGRTGGANENAHVDNVVFTTTVADRFLITGFNTGPGGVTMTTEDLNQSVVDPSLVVLKFDGQTVSPKVTKVGAVTTIEYSVAPNWLASGSPHTVDFSVKDVLGQERAGTRQFTVETYIRVPAAAAIPAAQVDKTKPGFIWNVFANSANQVNSNARTEAALAGKLVDADGNPLPNLADPSAQGVALAPANPPSPENAPITFEIETVINLSQNGADNVGNFRPDDVMPGIPATDGTDNGIAAEIITYLDLPAGIVTMVVNSDDGFRTTAGNVRDVFETIVLGQFDGGRGAANTTFTLLIEQAGIYEFRTIWEEGGGGANIEWLTVIGGKNVLINDVANGGVPAYRAATVMRNPYVRSVTPSPVPRQANEVSPSLVIDLGDGTQPVDDNSITLKVDGKGVTVTKARQGKWVMGTYAPTGLQIPTEAHTAELSYKDSTGAYSRTVAWAFRGLKNIVLPAPKILEDFDSYPEDSQPTGWRAWNFTSHNVDGRDITVQTSESYENWVLVNTANIPAIDGGRPFNITPGQFVDIGGTRVELKNGDPVGGTFPEWIMSFNVLYAESDGRNNADSRGATDFPNNGQTQFIETKPYDVSSFKGVVITFSSIYEQNQDSLGAVEYSVDGGVTWLPVVYFLDSPDIKLNADGTVDAVRTFRDANTDTSSWVDQGVNKGDNYGDGIAAPITAALGPFVVPRVNDGQVEGKRVEVFRLDQATGKSDVRLRFASLGTDSWYFAIDNLAFYDIPVTQAPSGLPVEFGQTVNGFQDDFTGPTRDPNWKARGPGGDVYRQIDGLLHVQTRTGDPNHLLYEAPGYNNSVQEVLARIRITSFGVGQDGPRAGLGAAVATGNSQGINLHFRNFTQDNVTGRQFKLLDDARAWGPPGLKIDWTTNTWYWLRLRHEPNAGGGTNDVFGKAWVADGTTPEPNDWQLKWNYIPTRTARTGFAGITGSVIDGIGNFEVDYTLIKADGLPSIKVDFAAQGPAPTVPRFTSLTRPTANRLVAEWIGAGKLQQADALIGPWADVANAASPRNITPTGAAKFYRILQ